MDQRNTQQASLALCLVLGACAGNDQELKNLATQMQTLHVRLNRAEDRAEETTTRLALLRQQIRQAESSRPPPLPLIKLEPAAQPPAPPPKKAPQAKKRQRAIAEYTLVGDSEKPVPRAASKRLRVTRVAPLPRLARAKRQPDLHRQQYDAALAAYRRGSAPQAAALFRRFADDHPNDIKAATARHWSGICLFEAEDYRGALAIFTALLKQHPDADKAPEALLKSGIAHLRLGQRQQAKVSFGRLISKFPHSALAELAQVRLAQVADVP